jgi:hypothetical protein
MNYTSETILSFISYNKKFERRIYKSEFTNFYYYNEYNLITNNETFFNHIDNIEELKNILLELKNETYGANQKYKWLLKYDKNHLYEEYFEEQYFNR